MTNTQADTTHPASPPDPPQDQPGKTTPVPEYIAAFLYAVGMLLGYGRHLLATVRHRAAAPTFPTIAACFGTSNLSTIIAHLNRGILRATALQRLLLARAATGQDINIVTRRTRTQDPEPAPADSQAEPPAEQPAKPKAAPRPSLLPGWDDPELFMPSQEELDLKVRRRAVGRTITKICRDLAVVPGFCASAFWNELFELMYYFGGNVATLMREKADREQAFIQEQDKKLGSIWDWLQLKRDEVRQVLGFFIGEAPVDPFGTPEAAPATGPPRRPDSSHAIPSQPCSRRGSCLPDASTPTPRPLQHQPALRKSYARRPRHRWQLYAAPPMFRAAMNSDHSGPRIALPRSRLPC